MSEITRRELLQTAAIAAALGATQAEAQELAASPAPAFSRQFEPKPLPFNAKSLRGLSEKLVVSHW